MLCNLIGHIFFIIRLWIRQKIPTRSQLLHCSFSSAVMILVSRRSSVNNTCVFLFVILLDITVSTSLIKFKVLQLLLLSVGFISHLHLGKSP